MTIDEMVADARQRLRRLEPQAAADAVRDGSVLIDVRTSEQRARDGTVPGAVPIGLNVLEWRADPASPAHDRRLGQGIPLIVLCAEGFCSSLAASRLVALDRDATDVIGGFAAWRRAGLPVRAPDHATREARHGAHGPGGERHVRAGDPGHGERPDGAA